MIDLLHERPISFSQVPKLPWLQQLREKHGLKEKGKSRRLHCSTVFRWASRGLNGKRLFRSAAQE
jgi:hypothetical protein